MATYNSENTGLAGSGDSSSNGNDYNGNLRDTHHQIGDQEVSISNGQALNLGIINQYGQLMGEFSRLDDELWFSKGEDHDAIEESCDGFDWDFVSNYESNVHLEKPSSFIDYSVSDGSTVPVKETSSSLKDFSLDQSQTSSPVSVLRKKKYPNLYNKRARSKRRCPVLLATELSESFLLAETDELLPAKRTKKMSDLLQSGSREAAQDPSLQPIQNRKPSQKPVKKCLHCDTRKTPQWREGPLGQATLCNACGVQYRKGRLFPEYRPVNCPSHKRKLPTKPVKKCLQCETTKTPRWRDGPMGHATLCNACGVQYRKAQLFRESRPINSPTQERKLSTRPVKKCLQCETTMSPKWRDGPMGQDTLCDTCGVQYRDSSLFPEYRSVNSPTQKKELPKKSAKKCLHCETTKTPQWREGPEGHGTLCNACGVQYRRGLLFPEYRPINSPTFDPSLHSNLPKMVQKMRMRNKTK